MNTFFTSITLSLIIVILSYFILLDNTQKSSYNDKISSGVKLFLISFVSIYIGNTFLFVDNNIQEIDIGHPDW